VLGGDPAGHRDLRQAVADYLRHARGVMCDAEQVLILSGIRQAVDLTCRLLLDPGDAVWLENPCYPGLRAAIAASAAKLVHVPVDEEGMAVDRALAMAPKARLACVAPSHQFPLGAMLSLQRRLQLLAWAREAGAWILEDDYDSEFRYEGRPLATLQSLDEDRVIYVGSLSKVMFPSLRIAYLVAPRPLAPAFRSARAAIDEHPPMTPQPALAAFFAEGHLAAHVRRQRKRYAERQGRLLMLAARHLAGKLEIAADPAGLHLLATPVKATAARSDSELSRGLAAAGIIAPPLGNYYVGRKRRSGLLLGYAAVPEAMMEPAVKRMAEVLPG
jgi:GntR family transcriptional regulator/MocR family aminotransferase